jgi:hypothetical protein
VGCHHHHSDDQVRTHAFIQDQEWEKLRQKRKKIINKLKIIKIINIMTSPKRGVEAAAEENG